MKTVNSLLLAAIKARTQPQSEFNSGILTADRYVKTLNACVGNELCERHGSTKDQKFSDALKAAESTLTYNNPDMVVTDVYSDLKDAFETEHKIELPKNTLMVFKHVLTTPRKDRDGDVLRTEGAKVDPKMLLLWQHVHTLPIGKMLKVLEHNAKTLTVLTAIVDINELAHDSAVMIENKMGRFSHGFRALSFCDLKDEPGTTGYSGFDVKEFEVMEESLVSVPANPDAEQQEILLDLIEGDKLTSSMMKSFGKRLRSTQKTTTVAGGFVEKKSEKSNETDTGCGCKGGGSGEQNAASGSSKEADAADASKSSEEDESSEGVMCPTCEVELKDGVCSKCGYKKSATPSGEKSVTGEKSFYGPLPNSWEDTQETLRKNLRSFLITNGAMIENKEDGPYSYSWILGTDAAKCVACVESAGNTTYYQMSWEKDLSGIAQFTGSPKQVMIRVSAEVLEKSKKAAGLGLKSEKAGKVLSSSTLDSIKEIEADLVEIHEHCSTRSGKALCVKASGTVKALITQAEAAKPPEGEIKPTPGGEGLLSMQAAATFLAKSTPEERSVIFGILKAQCSIDETTKVTEEVIKSLKSA